MATNGESARRVRAGESRSVSAQQEALGALAGVLERALPLAARVSRVVGTLALLAVGLSSVVGYLLWDALAPVSNRDGVLAALVLAVFLVPTVVLGAYWWTLRELMELPEKLVNLPEATAENRERLRRVMRGARRENRGVRSGAGSVWNLGQLLWSAKEYLEIYVPIVQVVNPLFLILVILSAITVLVSLPIVAIVAVV